LDFGSNTFVSVVFSFGGSDFTWDGGTEGSDTLDEVLSWDGCAEVEGIDELSGY
jgi:hypothetical protein